MPAERCPACGKETMWIREPRYEGFRRVGEVLRCTQCGWEAPADLEDDSPPRRPSIFSEEDRPTPPRLFADEGPPRVCRRCRHYVIHPFRQWCARHGRDTDATDTCADFEEARSSG